MQNEEDKLRRTINLPQMVLYGLGTTVGAGIYAMIGELAGVSGYFAPLAFLLAATLAGFTAMSFAELCGRYPKAAGASLYIQKGLGSIKLSTLTGALVILGGMVSAAALSNGFVGYFTQFIDMPRYAAIILILCILGAIAIWGIAQSVWLAAIVTLIEVFGLIWIVYVAREGFTQLPDSFHLFVPDLTMDDLTPIFLGGILAFYAFIGFEDMVDVAEEVKDVTRTLPKAIILTLIITTLLYVVVTFAAILAMPMEELVNSKAPLADIYERYTGNPPVIISIIGMFAIINGALVQIIMASRVFYGLGTRGQLPAIFGQVNPTTKTPVFATLLTVTCITVLAILGNLSILAQITSLLMLSVFAMVNFALWKLKPLQPAPKNVMVLPRWIPFVGAVVSAFFVVSKLIHVTG